MAPALAAATLSAALFAPPAVAAIDLPPGMTASYVVLDRASGKKVADGEHERFRSASVVKVLIALDYLETLGAGREIPPADAALMQPMLRSSANDPASELWARGGYGAVVDRMVAKLGLTDTAPPADPGRWGFTATSAADVARVYEYILDSADAGHRAFVMGHLRASTKCSDAWDQSWGIPSAVGEAWAVKQGWSAWGDAPPPGDQCTGGRSAPAPEGASTSDVDLTSPLMHTSGTVGAGDEKIVVVLTLQDKDTPFRESANRITALTKTVVSAA
ncbi:hypothetical protein A4R43_27795 [Amycolatopsis albispora]|uniref:Serine hydrolase n=1 Tax=Amycolatopsis albispora TaxID=1804986 RepID=A0A344LLC6_9PSEU|nr:hypothetical protein A4R43_27795 [Amycolatopsis albispora]